MQLRDTNLSCCGSAPSAPDHAVSLKKRKPTQACPDSHKNVSWKMKKGNSEQKLTFIYLLGKHKKIYKNIIKYLNIYKEISISKILLHMF